MLCQQLNLQLPHARPSRSSHDSVIPCWGESPSVGRSPSWNGSR